MKNAATISFTENEKKYFNYIGLADFMPETTLSSLVMIVKHHLLTFNYQNTYLYFEGRKPASERKIPHLDPDTLIQQMIIGD